MSGRRIGRIRAGRHSGTEASAAQGALPRRPSRCPGSGRPSPKRTTDEPAAQAKSGQGKDRTAAVREIGQALPSRGREGRAEVEGQRPSRREGRAREEGARRGDAGARHLRGAPAGPADPGRTGRGLLPDLRLDRLSASSSTTPTRSTSGRRRSGRELRPGAAEARPRRRGPRHVQPGARRAPRPGRTEQAVTLLENVVKVYKGTKTAADWPRRPSTDPSENLPLFLDRPAVRPSPAPEPAPEPAPAPPAVVVAQPKQVEGNATLTLPANPAELTPSQPSPLAMAATPDVGTKVPAMAPTACPPGFTAKTEAGSPRLRLAPGDRRRPRRRHDGLRSRRHLHDGQRRRPAPGSARAQGQALALLHRPARGDRPASSASSSRKRTTAASLPHSWSEDFKQRPVRRHRPWSW